MPNFASFSFVFLKLDRRPHCKIEGLLGVRGPHFVRRWFTLWYPRYVPQLWSKSNQVCNLHARFTV